MKLAGKLAILFLVATLIFVPLRAAYALGPLAGPYFGTNFTLKSGETLNEDLVVFGGSVTIEKDATVTGSIVLIGGSLALDGEGHHDVVVIGGAVSLGEAAHVYGNLVTVGAPVSRAEGARVDGEVVNNPTHPGINSSGTPLVTVPTIANPFWMLVNNVLGLFGTSLILGLLAALLVLFLPQQTHRVGDAILVKPAYSGAMGLVSILLLVVATVALVLFSILLITLPITLFLMFVLVVVFAAAGIFGWVSMGTEIGQRFATAFKTEIPLPLSAGLGTFLLYIVANSLGVIPVLGACIGWIIPTLLGLVALGSVFMTRFGTRPLTITATPVSVETNPPVETV